MQSFLLSWVNQMCMSLVKASLTSLCLYSEPDWIFLQIYPFPRCILFSNLSYFVPTILTLWKLVPFILGTFPEKLMSFINSLMGDYICYYFSLNQNNHICHCNLLLLYYILIYQAFLLLVSPIFYKTALYLNHIKILICDLKRCPRFHTL